MDDGALRVMRSTGTQRIDRPPPPDSLLLHAGSSSVQQPSAAASGSMSATQSTPGPKQLQDLLCISPIHSETEWHGGASFRESLASPTTGGDGDAKPPTTSLFVFSEDNAFRRAVGRLVSSAVFQDLVLTVILANCVFLALQVGSGSGPLKRSGAGSRK